MGLDQITVELQDPILGSDETWQNLVNNFSEIDLDLEYNELSHIRFRFHLHVPIFVSRQYMRHRNQSPNEMSGRYRTMPSEYLHLPDDVVEIYRKAQQKTEEEKKNRKPSIPDLTEPPTDIVEEWEELHRRIYEWYKIELDFLRNREKAGLITNTEYKRAREVLRGVLGTSFFTDIVATWDLNNFVKFLKLRLDPHAQPEIQETAQQMLDGLKATGKVDKALKYLNLI